MTAFEIVMLRRLQGLKQWKLAQRLNVSATILSEIENGKRPLTPEMKTKITKVFNELESKREAEAETKA